MRGKPLGERVVEVGSVTISPAAGELPVQARIRRPGGARLLDAKPEVAGGVDAGFDSRHTVGRGPGFGRERPEQTSLGAEVVVNGDPGNPRALGHLSDAHLGTELGNQLAGGGENAVARPFDIGPAEAQPVFPSAHVN